MSRKLRSDRCGLSPVLSSLILCGAVLVVGISIWGFAYSAGTTIQWDYFKDMSGKIKTIKERFVIERIAFANYSGENTLHVWIYNFGETPIEMDVYAYRASEILGSNLTGFTVRKDEVVEVLLRLQEPYPGDRLVVHAITREGNVVYESFSIPY